MARHAICTRVIGIPACRACRRNPTNAHPHGDWSDDWQAPVLEAAWPRAICKSVESVAQPEVAA